MQCAGHSLRTYPRRSRWRRSRLARARAGRCNSAQSGTAPRSASGVFPCRPAAASIYASGTGAGAGAAAKRAAAAPGAAFGRSHRARAARGLSAPPNPARTGAGTAVVKVYRKRTSASLTQIEQRMQDIRAVLSVARHPNLLPYQRFREIPKANAAFLVRQYFATNL